MPTVELTRDKAIRLFAYLKEFAQLRSKVIRDLENYESVLWFHQVPREPNCFTVAWGAEREDGIWLEVKGRKEPPLPPAPKVCQPWIDPAALSNSESEPLLKERIVDPALEEGVPFRFLDLSDFSQIRSQWSTYCSGPWKDWADEHRRWKSIQSVYAKLFMMYQDQKRLGEEYEIVLGIGLLTWTTHSNQRVRRHIVAGQTAISFDANRATFSVQASSDGVKLAIENDMLEPDERPSLEEQSAAEKKLAEVAENPWDKITIEILRSWVHGLDSQGVFSEDIEPEMRFGANPTVTFAPALILRKRNARSLIQCLAKIGENLKSGGEIPAGVQRLCQIIDEASFSQTQLENGNDVVAPLPLNESQETYFPLSANDKQLEIIERLRTRQGVLVQGPPGTGKSHTIANLICHLLATGKRVLITSQTPRALRVLRNKIPEQMAALCVSVLGGDVESLRNLEECVAGITDKQISWDSTLNEKKIKTIESDIYKLRKQRNEIDLKLRELREMETCSHSAGSDQYKGTPQVIAQLVAKNELIHNWFTDEISERSEIPISKDESKKLIVAYRTLTKERCDELTKKFIPRSSVPGLDEYLKFAEQENQAIERRDRCRAGLSKPLTAALLISNSLTRQQLAERLNRLLSDVSNVNRRPEHWVPQAVSDVLVGRDLRWRELQDGSAKLLKGLREKAQAADAREVQFPQEVPRQKLRADSEALLSHLNSGGGLGWWIFRSATVKDCLYLTTVVRVNGRKCDNQSVLSELIRHLDTLTAVERLWAAWKGIVERTDVSLPRQVAIIEESHEALNLAIALEKSLDEAKAAVMQVPGLAEPSWEVPDSIRQLVSEVETANAEASFLEAKGYFDDLTSRLRAIAAVPSAHHSITSALKAIETRSGEQWARFLEILEAAEEDRKLLQERNILAARLQANAPQLLDSVVNDPHNTAWDLRLANLDKTWRWSQASFWLRNFHSRDSFSLERERKHVEGMLTEKITALSAAKAWGHCFARLGEEQRQNLVAWAYEVKKIGKGTGKYAESHRRAAQRHMDSCRGAIPAWIMPFYRVMETVPPDPQSFDVVIVDEASQSGPEALALQYLGKQVIVVGDDQQISPDFVGVDQTAVQLLIDKYLTDFGLKNTFGVGYSLFDHANIRYGGRIVLREHFRCMPEIIRFSNDLCYRATPLIPLRQYPPERLEPIEIQHVREGFRQGGSSSASNPPEADAIVETILNCVSDPRYKEKTMGVISLQGEYQARAIQQLLGERLRQAGKEKEIDSRKIVCGDAYAFQGDERDIIFLSMVASATDQRGNPVQIGALTKEPDKRRFNVAASRARDQIFLFHTATLNDLNSDDMRAKLLAYYSNPQASVLSGPDWGRCESQLERDVGERIYARGYRIIVQYEPLGPDGKRIDLVVEGTKSRLAVECDGDYWHGPEKFDDDMKRQRQLERCGCIFWRIRGSEFYRDPESALKPLWSVLSEMGIFPLGAEPRASVKDESVESRASEFDAVMTTERAPADEENGAEDGVDAEGEISTTTSGGRDISDFHQEEVRSAIRQCASLLGRIDRETLLRETTKRLGFSRLGGRIRTRLNRTIGAEVRIGRMASSGEIVWSVNPRTLPEVKIGLRVYHPEFGDGTIVRKEGAGFSTKITVEFTGGIIKKLMLGPANETGLQVVQ